jgi:hypothetical protein
MGFLKTLKKQFPKAKGIRFIHYQVTGATTGTLVKSEDVEISDPTIDEQLENSGELMEFIDYCTITSSAAVVEIYLDFATEQVSVKNK